MQMSKIIKAINIKEIPCNYARKYLCDYKGKSYIVYKKTSDCGYPQVYTEDGTNITETEMSLPLILACG